MQKIIITLLLLLVGSMNMKGQTCQWAEKIAGFLTSDFIFDSAVDESGNVYVVGSFDVTDLSPLIFNNGITLSNSGSYDGYLAKYNSNGQCQWAEKISGKGSDNTRSISVDENGNVYVGGLFNSDTLIFNNGITLTNIGTHDGYLSKYNSSGQCQWAEKIVGGDGHDITVDGSENVYVAGYFYSDTLIFNNDKKLIKYGNFDGFIAKYNSNGQCQWAEKIGESRSDYSGNENINSANCLSIDGSGNVYVVGSFVAKTLLFNNGITLLNSGTHDGYLAKYNSNGQCQWAEKISGKGVEETNSVAVDEKGNVYVAGGFHSDTLNFNNSKTLTKYEIYTISDGFIAKYNSNGQCQWAERIGGKGSDDTKSIAVDKNGNVCIAGEFNSDLLIFNNGKKLSNSDGIPENYMIEGFIAKYNSSGQCLWAEMIAGTKDSDCARSVQVDGSSNVYVAGFFRSDTLKFNNGKSLTISGWTNGYIAKYTQDPESVSFDNDFSLEISPNPASDFIEISLIDNEAYLLASDIKIYNNFGECVSTTPSLRDTPSKKGNLRINISNLPNGIYFIQIGEYSKKFVVVR